MRKMSKRVFAVLLSVVMALSVFCGMMFTASAESGSCGDHMTWELENGVLTVSGTGDMYNYDDDAPWKDATVTSVIIEPRVETIGTKAFKGMTSIKSVTISESDDVYSYSAKSFFICGEAFKGCTALESVTFSWNDDSVGIKIEGYAFSECTSIRSIVLPVGTKSMEYGVFYGCTSLESVVIPGSVESIGNNAFDGCTALTSVTIGEGVQSISYGSFNGCTLLESVDIPGTVEVIAANAFFYCTALTSVTLGDGVTSIESNAFCGCALLDDVTIPDSVETIGGYAFYGCTSLVSVDIPGNVGTIGDAAFLGCIGLRSVTIGDGVETFGNDAFAGCTSLKSIFIPASVTTFGTHVFYGHGDDLTIYTPDADGAAAQYAAANGIKLVIADSIPAAQDEMTLTIDDRIGVNIKLDLDNAHAGAQTAAVTFRGKTTTYNVRGKSGQYRISFDVAPAYAAEEFTVSVDGTPIAQDIYSVREYCEALMETYPSDGTVYALAEATLLYAQAANDYFELGDEIAGPCILDQNFDWDYVYANATGLAIETISFMALTQPEYRFYEKDMTEEQAAAYNAAGVTAAYADANITDKPNARFVKTADGKVLLEVTGVTAQTMDKPIVVTIKGVGTLTFAGNDFAKLMTAGGGTTAALGAALYNYGVAAANYDQ